MYMYMYILYTLYICTCMYTCTCMYITVAHSKYPRGSTSGNTYQRTIHESKDVLKLIHVLSSAVLSCRHDLAKVSSTFQSIHVHVLNVHALYCIFPHTCTCTSCTCIGIHVDNTFYMYMYMYMYFCILCSCHVHVL